MHPKKLKAAFDKGQNITALLKLATKTEQNSEQIIEAAYDLQAGSYIQALEQPVVLAHKKAYAKSLATEILRLTSPISILEAGVGEGTTLSFVLSSLPDSIKYSHGFDISWSRVQFCSEWLRKNGFSDTFLAVASLMRTPYVDGSFDVVYTSHTIEPNGGQESSILKELFRITSRFLILLEPGYEFASREAQIRMESHGYCKNLVEHAKTLGMRVIKHELFPHSANPLNPTAITIIEKEARAKPAIPQLACPSFGDTLEGDTDSFYSQGSLLAYPRIKGVPCLRPCDGIIASWYDKC